MNSELQLQILGFAAGGLIIISFIPQLITIVKNKTSHNISFGMYIISLISQILWITFSILKNDIEILVTNIGTAFITILILSAALYYKYFDDLKKHNENNHTLDEI